MGIQYVYDEEAVCRHTSAIGAYRAAIICDDCGEEITRPKGGNVVFDRDRHGIPATVHKTCSMGFWSKQGVWPPPVPWNDVGHFVAELNHALGDAAKWSREWEQRFHAEPTDDPD